MIWATLDLDILEDPAFVELEDEVPGSFWCWVRLLQVAKRVNQQGLVLRADGRPLTAQDLHRIHRATSLQAWEGILDRCVELELLALDEGAYRIVDWRRWHRTPSDQPEQVAARVARHRAAKRTAHEPTDEPVTTCNEDVTTPVTACNGCNGCNDTEQSRAEQSRTEQSRANQSKAEKSKSSSKHARPVTPAPPPTPAANPGDSPAQVLERLRQFNANGQARSP